MSSPKLQTFCREFKCDDGVKAEKCYKKNARKGEWSHPDKGGNAEKFKQLGAKYSELSESEKETKCSTEKFNATSTATDQPTATDQSIPEQGVELGKAFFVTATHTAQSAFLSSSNFILSRMKGVVQQFVPSGNDVQDKQNLNSQLMAEVEQAVKSPIFQKKWKKFAEVFAGLIKTLITVTTQATANEMEAIADIFEKKGIKIFKKSARGTISAVSDVLSDIPGLGAAVAALSVFTTVANVGGEMVISSFELTSRVVNAFSEVAGGTLDPAVKAIESFKDIMETIKQLPSSATNSIPSIHQDAITDAVSDTVSDTVSSVKKTASKSLTDTTHAVQQFNKAQGGARKKKHIKKTKRKSRKQTCGGTRKRGMKKKR